MADDILINQPGLQGLRFDLLSSALGFYREFARLGGDDPRRSIDLAAAYVKMGMITSHVATKPECLPSIARHSTCSPARVSFRDKTRICFASEPQPSPV